jgi:toxin FitB
VRRRYLLDTSVISIFAPGRKESSPELDRWIDASEERLHLSTVTLFEIEQGAAKLHRLGGVARAAAYREWISRVGTRFGGRLLAVEAVVATIAGTVSDAARARGKHPGILDVLIAATAQAHDLTLLTRNLKHFEPLGLAVLDPVVTLPE